MTLKESDRAVLYGEGYGSEESARAAGQEWRSRLERAFACCRLAADFGDRAAKGRFTAAGLSAAEQAAGGQRFLNDTHGLTVFGMEPTPAGFLGIGPISGYAPVSRNRLEPVLMSRAGRRPMTVGESTAYDLYSASFLAEVDARFMLLMMALETLIEEQVRDDNVQALVDQFVALAEAADIVEEDRASLRGSLRYLRAESINQAGRRLAATLRGMTYGGSEPVALFKKCYRMRSALAHGKVPRPTREEVGQLAAPLELLVGDLIAGVDLLREVRQGLAGDTAAGTAGGSS